VDSPRGRAVLARLAAGYVRLVRATGRWHTPGRDVLKQYVDRGETIIVVLWHGRLLMGPRFWPGGMPLDVLVSDHRDGRIIAAAVARFGLGTVFGSTNRAGARAVRDLVRRLKGGTSVVITPDGPRGPRMRAAPGAVQVARLSGAAIVPLAVSAGRRRLLGSWDRFQVPGPFGRGVFLAGEPLHVPTDADAGACETARRTLEARLNALTAEADRQCGHPPVEPAPDPAAGGTGEAPA